MVEMIRENNEKPNITMGLIANHFPLESFREWEADCKKNFGNCRWIKIWYDHKASKAFEEISALHDKMNEMEERIIELETNKVKKIKEPDEKVKGKPMTLSGEVTQEGG